MSEITIIRRAALAVAALLALAAGLSDVAIAQSSIFNTSFDHFTTGWPLEGSHRSVDCASCHVGGIFQGTPRECTICHARAGLVKATAPPVDHIRTTEECGACHRETSWTYVKAVDHTAVLGSCSSCHDGRTATGKPPNHIPTGSDCGICHVTTAWRPAG